MLKAGDILVSRAGSVGKSFLIETDHEAVFASYLIRYRPKAVPKFVHYYMQTATYWAQIADDTLGIAIPNVNASKLDALLIPVPPVAVQKVIVARIDELLADVGEGERALDHASRNADLLERSLVAAGTRGELTANWRALNSSPKTGEELVHQIQYDSHARFVASRKRQSKAYDAPRTTSYLNIDHIPESWGRVPIGAVAECLDFMRVPINRKDRFERAGTVPYYGANGQVGWIDDFIFDEPIVLVVEDETFTGRKAPFSYLVRGKSWVNNHAHVLRAGKYIIPEYLNIVLSRYPFTPLTTGTTGRKKLTQAALMGAEIAVPPIPEQEAILKAIYDGMQSVADIVGGARQQTSLSSSLRQSILAAAFRGDLVA